ncbi:hypothetical protein F9288_06565 [Sphingomonas sp. CL5.1]|uniref:hypothetical protein n=1 Tax=Sphingomonas sp. CL5.1 TaxID=2653203 RepID=UPI001582025A|nr:hypothetical protein [Sphingomonas sp. CL5.1]QKR99339.1 hypothetical protein F9288_06565 [Sphingomonas sp. CL5.1]
MKAQTGGARSALILAAWFVAVRLAVLALGQRFDADNLTSWMQIADLALLREHLWRTLWYLHSQPPLFNLMIGLALRAGPAAFPWIVGTIYALVTLGGILAVHALLRDMTGRPRLAFVVAAWLCVSPAVLLFSQKLYYDGLVPWLLCMALWGLHAGLTRRSTGWLAFGFAMLAVTTLLRSMIHPVLFVALLAIVLLAAAGMRRRVLFAAALPAAAIGAVMLKNLVIFGSTALSSWAPLNVDHTTVDRLPLATREAMIREGKLSRFAVVQGFSPPPVYLAMLPPIPPTGEPSLDNLRKSTGEDNWNHILYTKIGAARTRDALVGLAADPVGFVGVLATSLYHFNRPPSEFKGLERNRAVIAPWERIGNAVVGLQPAAWLGRIDDPRRTTAPLLQVSLTELAVFPLYVGFGITVAARLLALLRARALTAMPPALASDAANLLLGGWVIVISSSFDVWENNRARFDIGPVLLIGALVFAARLLERRKERAAG